MKRLLLALFFAGLLLPACVVTPGPPGPGVYLAPPLPDVVVLDVEPYYYSGGYYYYYQGNAWYYSNSRGGPWYYLPRERWPRETRFKHGERGERYEREERRERGEHERD